MLRPEKLSDNQIFEELNSIPLWNRNGDSIVRDFSSSNFISAIGIVNSIAICAEIADHHPDILIYGWNKVKVKLTTADVGGLTGLDFSLAKKIDELGF